MRWMNLLVCYFFILTMIFHTNIGQLPHDNSGQLSQHSNSGQPWSVDSLKKWEGKDISNEMVWEAAMTDFTKKLHELNGKEAVVSTNHTAMEMAAADYWKNFMDFISEYNKVFHTHIGEVKHSNPWSKLDLSNDTVWNMVVDDLDKMLKDAIAKLDAAELEEADENIDETPFAI